MRLINFLNIPDNFVGGKISHFLDRWRKLTSDPWILDIIKGYKIEFKTLPRQRSQPKQLVFSVEENNFVQQELQKFLKKGIVRPTLVTKNQYISNIFLRPKRDGSHRAILNLKQLNTDIEHFHFKMETLKTALT